MRQVSLSSIKDYSEDRMWLDLLHEVPYDIVSPRSQNNRKSVTLNLMMSLEHAKNS